MKYLISILLIVSYSNSCDVEKFIQKLKEEQINTKLYNSNNQSLERIGQKKEKATGLIKTVVEEIDKRQKKENK